MDKNQTLSNSMVSPQIHLAETKLPIEVGVNVIEISPPQQDGLGLPSESLNEQVWLSAQVLIISNSVSDKENFFCVNTIYLLETLD